MTSVCTVLNLLQTIGCRAPTSVGIVCAGFCSVVIPRAGCICTTAIGELVLEKEVIERGQRLVAHCIALCRVKYSPHQRILQPSLGKVLGIRRGCGWSACISFGPTGQRNG